MTPDRVRDVPSDAPRIPPVLVFAVLTALFSAGYGVMFTALDDFRDHYGIGAGQLGMVVAAGFFSSFAAQVLLAPQADRGHARLLVYLGMFANIAGLLGMAFGKNLLSLLLARFVMGVGAGMASPAIRRIVILSEPGRLGHNLGRLLAADVGGFALGPAISAVLIEPFGIPAPFLLIALATVVCLPLVARVGVGDAEAEEVPSTRFAFDLLRERAFVATIAIGVAVFMMIGTFDSLWSLVLDDLDASDFVANLGITVFAVPLILFGSFGGRLAQRVGPFRLATVGLVLGSVFMFAYGLLPTGGAMLAVGVVHAVSDGLSVSSSGVAVGLVVPAERQAGAQGMLGGAQTLAGGVAAILAGSLYDHFGRGTAYTVCAAIMFGCVVASFLLAGDRYGLTGASVTNEPAVTPV